MPGTFPGSGRADYVVEAPYPSIPQIILPLVREKKFALYSAVLVVLGGLVCRILFQLLLRDWASYAVFRMLVFNQPPVNGTGVKS
jgi:hypothetical protein